MAIKKSRLERLRELRGYVNHESARYNATAEEVASLSAVPEQELTFGDRVTEFVRNVTRNHRESWTIPIVDELIESEVAERLAKAENKLRRRNHYRAGAVFELSYQARNGNDRGSRELLTVSRVGAIEEMTEGAYVRVGFSMHVNGSLTEIDHTEVNR